MGDTRVNESHGIWVESIPKGKNSASTKLKQTYDFSKSISPRGAYGEIEAVVHENVSIV